MIDGGAQVDDPEAADDADADALYRLLEDDVVPRYYDRDARDVPHRWIGLVKEVIRSIVPLFSTRRMLKQYAEQMYLPAMTSSVRASSPESSAASHRRPRP